MILGLRGRVRLASLAEAHRRRAVSRVLVRRGAERLAKSMVKSVTRLS